MGEYTEQVIEAMASTLWALAWADHVEETGCTNLSGCEITEHMPEVPEAAEKAARTLASKLAQCGERLDVGELFRRAQMADGRSPDDDPWGRRSERFGHCVALQALGHGVSWSDDHEPCRELDAALKGLGYYEVDLLADAEQACCGESGQ